MKQLFALAFTLILLSSCHKDIKCNGNCPQTLIDKLQKEPVGNPRAEIYKWTVKDKIYFYVPIHSCCDMMSDLYDAQCNLICHPDGGFGGGGDGKCPSFGSESVQKELVWKDGR